MSYFSFLFCGSYLRLFRVRNKLTDTAAFHSCAVGDAGAGDTKRPVSLALRCPRPRDETRNRGDSPTNSALAEIDSKESKIDTATKN